MSTRRAQKSASATKPTELELGRMMHKLLLLKSGSHGHYVWNRRTGRSVWTPHIAGKPFYTEADLARCFGLSKKQVRRRLLLYRITLPSVPDDVTRKWARAAAGARSLKPLDILKVRNQTFRRELMDIYGVDRLLIDGGGTKLQQDDFGTLWEIKVTDGRDRTMRWVEVVNTTPEPDGSYARYFLRVPPRMASARQAVAWVGGINGLQNFGGFLAES